METRLGAWHTVVAEWLSLDWTYSFRLDIKPYSFTMDPCNAHRLTCPGQHHYPAGIWVLRALNSQRKSKELKEKLISGVDKMLWTLSITLSRWYLIKNLQCAVTFIISLSSLTQTHEVRN